MPTAGSFRIQINSTRTAEIYPNSNYLHYLRQLIVSLSRSCADVFFVTDLLFGTFVAKVQGALEENVMKRLQRYYVLVPIVLAGLAVAVLAQTPTDTAAVRSGFVARANEYAAMRSKIEAGLPKLSGDATPEQIAAHKAALLKGVRDARKDAKHGYLITPEATALIRQIITTEYQGPDLAELKKTMIEAETAGVPVKVNAEYPESKEKVEMPPKLLMVLPELPDILRYRFVGKHMLIVDKENSLIVDYAADVIP